MERNEFDFKTRHLIYVVPDYISNMFLMLEKNGHLDEVVLVGGSMLMPMIRTVVLGAAIVA